MTAPEPGIAQEIAPGLRRILAPNPGPMTHWGTNSYVLGEGRVAVIDPGPESAAHLDALLKATRGEEITHILVTHAHADHSPLAKRLARATGAPIMGFGPAEAGRSALMERLATEGLAGGGEGVDGDFSPDKRLREGDRVQGDGWVLDVLHTPGHFAGHLAFRFGDEVVTGDHVMDWASSLVSPPDGDLGAFMATSERLKGLNAARFHTGHGNAIEAPNDRLEWLINHRKERGSAIRANLGARPQTVTEITARVYSDIPEKMLPIAARNVFAHLIDLVERNQACALPRLGLSAEFTHL